MKTFLSQYLSHQLKVHVILLFSGERAKDGSYVGASPYDAFDYRHEVKIQIKEGKIVTLALMQAYIHYL